MLVTALLLSLGAPFWYSALGRLLQLRSVLASKDDKQRSERPGDDDAGARNRDHRNGRHGADGRARQRRRVRLSGRLPTLD